MNYPISANPGRMGRPPLNIKATVVRLSKEALERIEALVGKQKMAEFIRDAVERELKRRERKKK
jgi:predicted DNA-binding protein